MTQAPLALLERLRVDGVIRADHHAAALMRLEAMPVAPFVTLGGALVWLATEEILSDLDLDEMFELAATEGAFSGNVTRRQAIAELNALCQHEFDRHVAQLERGGLLKALLPGPLWAWFGGAAIAIAAVAWYILAPDWTSQCGDAAMERPNGEGDMVVSAADPRVVRVRFGQAGNHGKPLDMGQPADSDAIVRARVAELKRDEAAAQPENFPRQQPDNSGGGGAPR